MNITSAQILRIAAICGALGVILGAFGAHGLKPYLDAYQAGIYEKGVHYQFFHTFALALTGLLLERRQESRRLRYAAWLFLAGIVFFSGSLYLLSCKELMPVSVAWAGPVTPIGGLCFIAGWMMLAFDR
jgi:uncharacterized membrane protein YgdD (TMEM256/DUF423 family)